MQENSIIRQTTALIIRDFELDMELQNLQEDELLTLIADVVAHLLEKRFEFLMQVLYRLDVDEEKMRAALSFENPEPANISLAKTILERQKQRVFTRQKYSTAKTKKRDWFDFECYEL